MRGGPRRAKGKSRVRDTQGESFRVLFLCGVPEEGMKIYQRGEQLIAVQGDGAVRLEGLTMDELYTAPEPMELVMRRIREGQASPVALPSLAEAWDAPVQSQEVWAAGVTYYRSREARMDEAKEVGADRFYDLVYGARRPELFFKGTAARMRGHLAGVRIREDSTWDVPEPELALAINSAGRVFGFTIGNDMSSREIEGENPLYLPQAKVYRGSCGLGPCLLLAEEIDGATGIHLTIIRAGAEVFSGSTSLSQMKRTAAELADWLYRENEFPHGSVLLTGTGLVPPGRWTLAPGDVIRIGIDGIGLLENSVEPR